MNRAVAYRVIGRSHMLPAICSLYASDPRILSFFRHSYLCLIFLIVFSHPVSDDQPFASTGKQVAAKTEADSILHSSLCDPVSSLSLNDAMAVREVLTNHQSDEAAISYHRPFLRSALARSLYDRMMREEQLRKMDTTKWYTCDMQLIVSLKPDLVDKFIQMELDDETNKFIDTCYQKSEWFVTQLYHSIARSFLNLFMTSTSTNGLLDRGSMFVFSSQQFRTLYPDADQQTDGTESCLLDLGAGDGKVTQVMAPFFGQTYVTEVSPIMRRILSRKNFNVLDVETWQDTNLTFDLIAGLNLLDRCDRPITILNQMTSRLKPNGKIILALVLPLSQYVESGREGRAADDHRPSEVLNVTGETFEHQLVSLEANVLTPVGLEIVKWTRLPYLCEGDLDLSFYWLHDVVMLLRRKSDDE